MATRSFKGYVPATAPEIELESPDGTRRITARCVPNLPGSVLLDFMAKVDEGDVAKMADMVRELLNTCIIDADQEAFWAFCEVPENGIGVDTLSSVTEYLSEVYSEDRPTQPSAV
jgi:hypothetical protein